MESGMRLLDLYCGAGGAGMGYHRAGFTEIVGVDIDPQPHYPFTFVQDDAIAYTIEHGREFDAVHASPPCQRYCVMTKHTSAAKRKAGTRTAPDCPDLVAPTRRWISALNIPFVIENVPGSPLSDPILLCGSHFGLGVRRHRLFELHGFQLLQPACEHNLQGRVIGVYGHAGGSSKRDGLSFGGVDTWREAMGIDWMTGKELAESIPPAYTEHIGKHLMEVLVS